ncbi:hypothetical protein, partial [Sphingomonas sp. CFBP 13733]|uniref:hypothetical protein n=1 Tax=Sphingomonas sp. CFBP 13733 TaxID=2775291 RepID=UPI001A7E82F7
CGDTPLGPIPNPVKRKFHFYGNFSLRNRCKACGTPYPRFLPVLMSRIVQLRVQIPRYKPLRPIETPNEKAGAR